MKKAEIILSSIQKIMFFSLFISVSTLYGQTSTTFSFSGAPEDFVVPICVTSIDIEIAGAQGGGVAGADGGNGAVINVTIPVVPGDIINMNIGGAGGCPGSGYNGGGIGWNSSDGTAGYGSCGGGGSTDILLNGALYAIAAGGGGCGGGSVSTNDGGDGGCGNGSTGGNTYGDGGLGGSQAAGGASGAPWAGTPGAPNPTNGSSGQGGDGGYWSTASGGGGGGGYFGGGGGGHDGCCTGANGGGGGGGGSSLVPGGAGCTDGLNTGDGYVTITYTQNLPVGGMASLNLPTICDGDTSQLVLTGSNGTIQWQSAPTNSGPWTDMVGATTTPFSLGVQNIGVNTFFRAVVSFCGTDTSDVTELTINPLPPVDAGLDQVLCENDQTTLDGAGAVTYIWDNGITDATTFGPAVGTLMYTVEGTDANGCVNTDSAEILVNPLPIIVAGVDVMVCDGVSVTLTASGAVTYVWDNGITNAVTFTPAVGTITYTATGTDANGCVNTDDVDVVVNPLDDPSFNYPLGNAFCQTGVNPDVAFTGMSGGSFFTTVVSGGPTIDIVPNNGTINLATSDAGEYTITYSTMGAPTSLCPQTSSLNVIIGTPPEADFYIDDFCDVENDPVPTFLLGGVPGVFTSIESGLLIDPTTGEVDLDASTPGIYTVVNTVSVIGCADVVYTDEMIIYETPVALFGSTPQVANTQDTYVDFNNETLFADAYEWDFGDQTPISNIQDPTHEFPEDVVGQYTVTLIAYNGSTACTDTISKIVYVEDVIVFYIPNAFTPDGDDYNETFQPYFYSGVDPYDFHFTIFNRWGEIIWESYNPSAGWDGSYGSRGLVESGTYVWTLEFRETMSDKRHYHNGHVTVLK